MNAYLRSQRKRRGHGRLDRVKTGLLDRNLPSETKEHAKTHTQARRTVPLYNPNLIGAAALFYDMER